MIVTLIKVVPGVRFDAICVVRHTPSDLIIFAYDYIRLTSSTILKLILYSVAFVLFETILFVLTLFKFLVALRNGWGRTPVVYLLVRDGTWAFILIFGSPTCFFPAILLYLHTQSVTLCVNAGFYLGAGNSAIAAIAFPWLLSIESFAGARIVLNLHALSFDVSTDTAGTSGGGGTLSSHIVFTTHPSAANHARTPSVRWDWGGLQEYSYDERSGYATGSRSGGATGTVNESYEMTRTAGGSGSGTRKYGSNTNGSATDYTSPNTLSDTCIDVEDDIT